MIPESGKGMKLLKKFRAVMCFFIAYICIVAFSLAATNRAPVRNNESLILTDYSNGFEIENIPYGNHSLSMTIKDRYVLHAPVSFMSGESFHIKYEASLAGAAEAQVTTDLSAGEYDMSACSFDVALKEGDNVVEGDLVFEGVNHPESGEINIYTNTPGVEITVTKPQFTRVEKNKVGYLACTALALAVIFLVIGIVLLLIDVLCIFKK